MNLTQKLIDTDKAGNRSVNTHTTNSNQGSLLSDSSKGVRKDGVFSRVSWGKFSLFFIVALAWFALDVVSKTYANSYDRGDVFAGPFGGLFQFKLTYNTGAAWSMFSGSTLLLGLIAVVVLIVLLFLMAIFSRHVTWIEAFSLGLVFAGGIGNALDRFTLGYVVDFIQTLFISFPTFNVADIGITCGVVLFLISFLYRTFKQDSEEKEGN